MKSQPQERHPTIESMNTQNQKRRGVWRQGLAVTVLALAGAWLAGCSTTVYQRGDRAAGSAQAAAMQAQTESQALAGTMATLNSLVDKPAADLKPQYQSFNSALDGLIAAWKQGGVAGNHLVRSNAAYLAAWDKQLTAMTNADVRSRSAARRTEVSNQFNATNSRYLQAQDSLRSLIDYLQDIRRALSADLTPSGVEGTKRLVSNANTTASKVQSDLAQASTDLRTLSASMSSARGP